MVTPTPKAIDSPAEPVVCTMLFSRIVARPEAEHLEKARNSVIDRTATGIEAETVMPDLEHQIERRGAEDNAQQVTPSSTADQVNSGSLALSGT